MSLHLEKQLTFYGAYHHNSVNVGIHVTCVPAILLSALLLASNSPSVPLPSYLSIPNLPVNLGTFAAFGYSILYILMEPVAGSLLFPILMGSTAYSNHLIAAYGNTANKWAGAVHIFAWIAQFIGHGAFEGRAPALLDNLVQALFLAPFFVWMEILFFLGYRPELKSRVNKAIQVEIERFKKTKADKKLNGKSS
ncbi:gb [Venturia nashicola]|uniref:Gb n=1 Tax=Venturia nashicola TaxID=86259 RepID=A0A4Z1NRQ8_9PEZI|nr:gb [Venturia nashicola]